MKPSDYIDDISSLDLDVVREAAAVIRSRFGNLDDLMPELQDFVCIVVYLMTNYLATSGEAFIRRALQALLAANGEQNEREIEKLREYVPDLIYAHSLLVDTIPMMRSRKHLCTLGDWKNLQRVLLCDTKYRIRNLLKKKLITCLIEAKIRGSRFPDLPGIYTQVFAAAINGPSVTL